MNGSTGSTLTNNVQLTLHKGLTPTSGAEWLEQINTHAPVKPFRILNVCGGHERTIGHAGMRAVMPSSIELIPGPGCPVCVCPEEDLYDVIQLARGKNVCVVAFGDMLNVPINAPKNEPRSLAQARAEGADVRPIASPQQAVEVASANPGKPVVFFAAGFETTMAPVAAMLAEGVPDNLTLVASGRRTWPAVEHLLSTGNAAFDALIAPGHVATIMGAHEWMFVVDEYHIPTAIAGFHDESLLAAIYALVVQKEQGRPTLENHYPELVRLSGNPNAQTILSNVFEVIDANWRGIGEIPRSGYKLGKDFEKHDARIVFELHTDSNRKRLGEMPPGCDCANVVLGQIYPNDCQLYGAACRPDHPIGPCMVSDEGACRIWWSNGIRNQERV